MDYSECLKYLAGLNEKYGISPGLDTISRLLLSCGCPQDKSRVIHVAGTNGKGSVSTFISYILSAAGYRVGRYISPAVNGYCEKIQYIENNNITYISENEVCRYINILREKSEEIYDRTEKHPTEFEIETAMAFIAFDEWDCDYVVLECGMGGILDATNVIKNKELCVFTSISMDHERYLGNTLSDIAENKAGILTDNICAVSSSQVKEVTEVLIRCADKHRCNLSFIKEYKVLKTGIEGSVIIYDGKKWRIKLSGAYQAENAATAIEAVKVFAKDRFILDDDTIQKGLINARWPKRFEIIRKEPYVVIDGAHNPNGVRMLVKSINELFPKEAFYRTGIMGVFSDKDISGMIAETAGVFNELHTVTPSGKRGLAAGILAEKIHDISGAECIPHDNITAEELCICLESLLDEDKEDNAVIVIFGSLSLAAKN